MSGADPVAVAQELADELLFPAALATDRADVLPKQLLDALADAGLYGLAAPASVGGFDADFEATCSVIEALSSGCLTTAFVWAQHLGAVHTVSLSESEPLRAEWLEPLASGARRGGLALGGAVPRPTLHAQRGKGGWVFEGNTPWLSGWGRIDVVHTAARAEDGTIVWAFVDAREDETLVVERLDLVALNATASVRADFRAGFVPDERVTSVVPAPAPDAPTPREVLRIHASLGLGVASRCCRLLGASPLDDELNACRAELDAADTDAMPVARAAASDLALRASAALMVSSGSRSVLLDDHAQRLAREALFVSVYAGRPPVRAALLERLTRGRLRASGGSRA
jgi:alkylation response protein AidB-like acyl-CoA dehydrogenase